MDSAQGSPLDRITFACGTRDRADHLRGDEAALAALQAAPEARVLPLWRGQPLIDDTGADPALGWLPASDPVLDAAAAPPIFLGLEGGAGRFALDLSAWRPPEGMETPPPRNMFTPSSQRHPDLPEGLAFHELRGVMGRLPEQDAADAATARAMMEWHRSHRHCARCGAASEADQAGWRRSCPACGAQHFPRTDPVVIQLITRGDKVLLGRQPSWPRGFWSLLAGFVEPGETLEAAVRRETMEEAGVPVGRVSYLACQPWPFPNSLMFAMAGEALDDRIVIDPKELEDAKWVSRLELLDALDGNNPDLTPGRHGAIAHAVLTAWAEGAIGGA